jgi:hypothetical protein
VVAVFYGHNQGSFAWQQIFLASAPRFNKA